MPWAILWCRSLICLFDSIETMAVT